MHTGLSMNPFFIFCPIDMDLSLKSTSVQEDSSFIYILLLNLDCKMCTHHNPSLNVPCVYWCHECVVDKHMCFEILKLNLLKSLNSEHE